MGDNVADLKTCDSCGGRLTANGQDMFWGVQVQIRKGIAWTALERDRRDRMVKAAKLNGDLGLAASLADAEPATFPGDKIANLVTHADLRICFACVLTDWTSVTLIGGKPGGVNLIDLIRAAERGPGVSSSETA